MNTLKAHGLLKTVTFFATTAALSACLPPEDSKLLARSGLNSVCMKEDLAIVGFSEVFSLFGNASIRGDLLLFSGSGFSMGGNACVDGKVFLDFMAPKSTVGGSRVLHGIERKDWSYEKNLLLNFESSISKLSPTQEVDLVQSSSTFHGKRGVNVIHVRKDLDLVGQSKLTLVGSERDVFVLNVDGDIRLSGQASIVLSGGIKPQNVIINNGGSGADIQVSGGAQINGTLMALNRGISITGNVSIKGAVIIGLSIHLTGTGSVFSPGAFCVIAEDASEDHHHHDECSSSDSDRDSERDMVRDSDDDHEGSCSITPPAPVPSASPTPDPSVTPTPDPSSTPVPSPSATPIPGTDPSPSPSSDPSPAPTSCSGPICNGGVLGV